MSPMWTFPNSRRAYSTSFRAPVVAGASPGETNSGEEESSRVMDARREGEGELMPGKHPRNEVDSRILLLNVLVPKSIP